jgi:nucleotide-binding universal stress UspA family protein
MAVELSSHEDAAVMVAYDGSPPARRALLHAGALVGRGGRVTVVNVIPAQGVSSRLETVSDTKLARQRDLLREARRLLAKQDVDAQLVAVAGDPAVEIAAAARNRNARIVVVGRHDRRLGRFVRASLSSKLLRQPSFDVLVVH